MQEQRNPEKGKLYTRAEVRDLIGGGSIQSYLPTKDGRILAGVFTYKDNPLGPEKVFAGTGPIIERGAIQVARERQRLPVFMKKGNKEYEFVGYYRSTGLDTSPEAIADADKRIASRGHSA